MRDIEVIDAMLSVGIEPEKIRGVIAQMMTRHEVVREQTRLRVARYRMRQREAKSLIGTETRNTLHALHSVTPVSPSSSSPSPSPSPSSSSPPHPLNNYSPILIPDSSSIIPSSPDLFSPKTDSSKPPTAARTHDRKNLDGFNEFWKAYPRREGKGQAEKAWIAAVKSGVTPDKIIAAAQLYASAKSATERQFLRLPATWINGKGWEDDCATPPAIHHRSVEQWQKDMLNWANTGNWPSGIGPEPSERGCLCPTEILKRLNIAQAA